MHGYGAEAHLRSRTLQIVFFFKTFNNYTKDPPQVQSVLRTTGKRETQTHLMHFELWTSNNLNKMQDESVAALTSCCHPRMKWHPVAWHGTSHPQPERRDRQTDRISYHYHHAHSVWSIIHSPPWDHASTKYTWQASTVLELLSLQHLTWEQTNKKWMKGIYHTQCQSY